MTNPQNSGQQPEPRSRSRWRTLLRVGLALGSLALVGVAIGAWWAWRFIQEELAPLVADNLSETFDRPVEVGPIEGVSFTSLNIGESSVPPTETDPDRLIIPAIEVRFNPLELLWDRVLSLDVILDRPEIYIEQDEGGLWIATTIQQKEDEPEPFIKIELDTLQFREGTLRLAPYVEVEADEADEPAEADIPPGVEIVPETEEGAETTDEPTASETAISPVIAITNLNGDVTFRNDNQLISFDIAGLPDSGGNLSIEGRANLEDREVLLQVDSEEVQAADIGLLLPLPLKLNAGLLTSDLTVQLPILQGDDEDPGEETDSDADNTPEDDQTQANQDQDDRTQTEPGDPGPDPFLANLFLNGTVQFQNATARLEALPKPFTQGNGRLRFQGQNLFFQNIQARYGEIDARVSGGLNFLEGYDLTIRAPEVTATALLNTFDVDESTLPIELDGVFQSELKVSGAIDSPVLTGVAENTELVQVDRVLFDTTSTRFVITPEGITFEDIAAIPADGGQITGTGVVQFGEDGGLVFDLDAENLPGDAIAQAYGSNQENFTVGRVDATAQVFGSLGDVSSLQTVVQWQAPQATYPGRGRVAITGDVIRFQDTVLLVAGGIVRGEGLISQGRWLADIEGSGIELSQFSPDQRGLAGGRFQLSGSLDDLSLAGIQAEGEVAFSEGISLITEPLTASIRWLGDRLQIVQASAPGFSLDGFVGVRLEGEGAPGVSNLDLNLALQNYSLAELPVATPETVRLAGTVDFNGQIRGTPESPNVTGRLGLYDFAVNQLAFEPVLTGDVRFNNQGLNLDLAGTQDQIAVVLDSQYRPVSFLIRQGETVAEGRGQGDRLLATLQNFPLEVLNLAPAADLGLGAVAGRLDGSFDINLADLSNPQVMGEFAITQPSIDYISADFLTGRFRYFDGVAVLDEGELRRGGSRYLLSGNFNPAAQQQFQGKIIAAPGRVEDIFAALRWFELTDLTRGIGVPTYGSSTDVVTIEVGIPDATLLNQLRRYSEIVALRNQQIAARENGSFLPDLATLQGAFTGEVNIAYSTDAGPAVSFDLSGQDWVWGDYQVNQVIAQGGFENGILTLRPVQFKTDDSFLRFTGQVGGEEQSGQLLAQNISVEALQELFRLPLDVQGGVLNANAFLSGSIGNPQLIGEILLNDVMLNNVTAPPVRTLFGYSNARLKVDSDVVNDEDDVFAFNANIPYRLPFMTVAPDSNDFSVNLNIRNNGLALISLFTDQVAWAGGEGDVQLQAIGSIDTSPNQEPQVDLTATGRATFTNAQFSAKALPEDITNVNGTVLFNGDRIQVESLQGEFSDGQVNVQGTLPILIPLNADNPNEAAPLNIALQNVDLQFNNLYDGGVDGQVSIRGTALAPLIGGDIVLRDGEVLIPDAAQAPPTGTTTTSEFNPGIVTPPEFEDLRLVLGDRLRVTKEPLLSFLVRGDLLINGTQDDLRPEGVIYIESGQVNLFTTQFYLDRDYENVAEFSPSRGLDPYLDVRLVTSVPEITRAPMAQVSPLTTSEIAETPAFEYGALQTIRVEASVMGPASQIYNNLELTSSPRRSEAEIVALLGGNFASTLGQGGAAALANIAGATILTGLQNFISDTTGLTDFRLYPTNVISEDERTSALALAAELGFDITDNLSVSVLQLLTVEDPTRFSLRYRLNDEFTLRGSTDTEGNSQVILEFQTRF